jgi:hypothetical protein
MLNAALGGRVCYGSIWHEGLKTGLTVARQFIGTAQKQAILAHSGAISRDARPNARFTVPKA